MTEAMEKVVITEKNDFHEYLERIAKIEEKIEAILDILDSMRARS